MLWASIGIVFGAGALGGLLNAFLTDNGFILPKREQASGSTILRPGALGNAIVGAFGAVVSWGLYGPVATIVVIGAARTPAQATLSVGAIVGALLVGIGGARWLSSEVDKRLFQAATVAAAGGTPAAVQGLVSAPPAQALAIARDIGKARR